MRHVVVIAPSFSPRKGGVEKHLQEVLPYLSGKVSLTVLVRYHEDIPVRQTVGGVHVYRLPRRDNRFGLWLWAARHGWIGRRVDAVHSHDYFPYALIRLFKGARRIHTFHGYEGYPLDPDAIKSRQWVRSVVDYAFGVGQFIETWYHTVCDAYFYGATSMRPTNPAPKAEWDAIFYGRLEADTGVESYVNGFRILHQSLPGAKMLVVGDGSLRAELAALIERERLPIELRPATDKIQALIERSRIAFVAGYLAIAEAAVLRRSIIALYETPIKHDYLTFHPLAKDMAIVSTPDEIAAAAQTVLGTPDVTITRRLDTAEAWALDQTWESIARLYLAQYLR